MFKITSFGVNSTASLYTDITCVGIDINKC